MSKTNIVLAGHGCIDHNTVEGASNTTWGSPLVYMTKYFSAHYPDATIHALAPHGKDFLPYAEGIDLYPKQPADNPTMVYRNVVVDGVRTQYCQNTEFSEPPALDVAIIQHLKEADIVFVAPLSPQFDTTYVQHLLSHTPVTATKVLLPQGYLRQIGEDGLVTPRPFNEATDVIPLFDLVILSDEDLPNAIASARTWKQQAPDTAIIVTENKRGAELVGPGNNQQFPTEPVPVEGIKNPIGCGDVFSAALAYHYSQTKDLPAAIATGHKMARQSLLKSI